MTRYRRSQDVLWQSIAYDATSMRIAKDTEQTRDTILPTSVTACLTSEVEIGQYPIPQIQGVVPGIRRFSQPTSSSHSLIHSFDSPLSIASDASTANEPGPIQDKKAPNTNTNTTALQPTHSTTSRRSNYPRASPPCFLYPVPIVPYTFPPALLGTEHTRCVRTKDPQQSISALVTSPMQRSDAPPVASLPISLKIIFLVTLSVIVLGVIWSVMIFCIVFPPGSWKIFRRGQQHSSNVVEHTEARRDGIELQPVNNSGNTGHNAQPPSASTRRHSYTAQDDNPFSSRTTLSAASSPYNPFLDPPAVQGAGLQRPRRAHKVRSSREWKEAHAAFFGGAGNTVKSSTGEASKTTQQAVEEESAVVGAASIREERADVGEKDGGKKENGEDALVTKAVEKVDETLGMIDDAVDKAAEGIARWTEDKKVD